MPETITTPEQLEMVICAVNHGTEADEEHLEHMLIHNLHFNQIMVGMLSELVARNTDTKDLLIAIGAIMLRVGYYIGKPEALPMPAKREGQE